MISLDTAYKVELLAISSKTSGALTNPNTTDMFLELEENLAAKVLCQTFS
jgi:hypothetical protein